MVTCSTWRFRTILAFVAVLLLIAFLTLPPREVPKATMSTGDTGVIHIVHFQFKAGTSESDKQHVRFVEALK